MSISFQPNTIYCGDCRDVTRHFPESSVDLIYLDPPFFSNRHYEILWGDGYELRAFEDRWKGHIKNYIGWMMERLRELHRILKPTGSLYLHCDWHASHYLKVELDDLFQSNFVNEIIWKRQTAHSDTKQGAKHLGRLHDTILVFSKSEAYTWNPQYVPLNEEYVNKFYKFVEPETGRRYSLGDLGAPGGADPSKGNPYFEFMGIKRYWRYSQENMQKMLEEGKIIQPNPGNVPRQKRYLDENPGMQLQDIWDDILPPQKDERLGYPTQKPEALLERIIKLSSNPNDIVLDPFCGCGTALVVAEKLGRRWVGIDVSPTACKLMVKRLRKTAKITPQIVGLPRTIQDLQKLEPFEFQNWVVDKLNGRVNPRKVGGMGIDGWVELDVPLQVKQSEGVGRKVVDEFETAIKRYSKNKPEKRGVIVGFSFTKDAWDEVSDVKLRENIEIKLLTVKEILGTS